jgi:CheY-like chemotaxis protein
MSAVSLVGVSLLLVEDDADGREILETYFRFLGATVRQLQAPPMPSNSSRQRRPQAVITDIGMPGRDGFWRLDQIRALPAVPHVPVVAYTGRVMAEERRRVAAAGFDAHLVKPLRFGRAHYGRAIVDLRCALTPLTGTTA